VNKVINLWVNEVSSITHFQFTMQIFWYDFQFAWLMLLQQVLCTSIKSWRSIVDEALMSEKTTLTTKSKLFLLRPKLFVNLTANT